MNSDEKELSRLQKRFQEAAKVIDDLSRIKQELDKVSINYKDQLSNYSQEIDSLSSDYKEYKKYWNENFNIIVKKNEDLLNKIIEIGNQTQSELEQNKTQLDKLEKSLNETQSFLSEFKNNVKFNKNLTISSFLVGFIALGLGIYSILFLPKNYTNTASPSPQEINPNVVSPSSKNLLIQVDFFREGVNKATRAATLAQSAKSKDEWNIVANEWQSAIDLMKSIPASNSNYEVAQKKVLEYQNNLDYARQQAERVIP